MPIVSVRSRVCRARWPRGRRSGARAGRREPRIRSLQPGTRVLLDAHNAYPDGDAGGTGSTAPWRRACPWPSSRISSGTASRRARAARSSATASRSRGASPACASTSSNASGRSWRRPWPSRTARQWPLVTLNLDFKTDEPEHHAAVWALLGEYEEWLTTAPRTDTASRRSHRSRWDRCSCSPVRPPRRKCRSTIACRSAEHLRLFGAVRVERGPARRVPPDTPDDAIAPRRAAWARTNYRRWWNNPWAAVEGGGPTRAGAWTPADEARLHALVRQAHDAGLWIRFYTLNGHAGTRAGWYEGYNFGSRAAVEARWRAAIAAGSISWPPISTRSSPRSAAGAATRAARAPARSRR
jgi:hypothetical protein